MEKLCSVNVSKKTVVEINKNKTNKLGLVIKDTSRKVDLKRFLKTSSFIRRELRKGLRILSAGIGSLHYEQKLKLKKYLWLKSEGAVSRRVLSIRVTIPVIASCIIRLLYHSKKKLKADAWA